VQELSVVFAPERRARSNEPRFSQEPAEPQGLARLYAEFARDALEGEYQ